MYYRKMIRSLQNYSLSSVLNIAQWHRIPLGASGVCAVLLLLFINYHRSHQLSSYKFYWHSVNIKSAC